jgi:hypothetical protein
MQVSALNMIIAAQQARNTPPQRPAPPTIENPKAAGPVSSFSPPAFKAESAPLQGAPANSYSPSAPLGSQIDIRI